MKNLIAILLLLITTFSSYADLRRQEGADVPAGTMISFAGSTCPAGFIKNDGTAISRTTYSKLFSAIGTSYGSGDGSTTFTLPKSDWRVDVGIENASSISMTYTGNYTSWTEVTTSFSYVHSVVSHPGGIMLICRSGGGASTAVYNSTNGTSWSLLATVSGAGVEATYGDGLFVITTQFNTYTSSDMVNWTTVNSLSGGQNNGGIGYCNKFFYNQYASGSGGTLRTAKR